MCLHGLGVSPRYLAPLVQALASERPVRAPHFPQGLPVERWAELTVQALEAPAAVFAHSLGCQAAVEVAVLRPDLVTSLVLVAPTADPVAPTLRAHFVRLVRDLPLEPVDLNVVVAADYVRNGPLRTLRGARLMLAHDMRRRLPLVEVPAVVVRGARDPIVPQRWAEEVARLLPDATVVVVPDAAHCAPYTHPDAVAASERRR